MSKPAVHDGPHERTAPPPRPTVPRQQPTGPSPRHDRRPGEGQPSRSAVPHDHAWRSARGQGSAHLVQYHRDLRGLSWPQPAETDDR
jgi:hypothetical protein